ncbi:hypothetical protein NC651_037897 [Populus alba x Populus x berolinensis]|nr:hypothetical protein NC651_037897 [Populus alba x Populus x berolinensis]
MSKGFPLSPPIELLSRASTVMVSRLLISLASPLWVRRSLKLTNSGYCARILVMLKAVEVEEIKYKIAMKRREETLESIFVKRCCQTLLPYYYYYCYLFCWNSKQIMLRPL